MAAAASNDKNKTAHFTYIWTVKSARSYLYLPSPVFTAQPLEMTKWHLEMEISCSFTHVSLFIKREYEDGGPECIEVELEISFLDTNGSSLVNRSGTRHFRKGERSDPFEFVEKDALFDRRGDEYFPKDPLTIRCRIWRTGTEISKSEVCFASTQFDVHRLSCVWAVKRFSSLQQGEKRIRILNTTVKGCPRLILGLFLDKKILCIQLEAHLQKSFVMEAKITVLDGGGMAILSEHNSAFLDDSYIRPWSLFKFRPVGAVYFDDVLLLRFELKLTSLDNVWSGIEDYKLMDYSSSKSVPAEKREAHRDDMNETSICPFKDKVNTFKDDGTLSDVCLRAGSKSFPVHKLILSSRSPVFRAMFTQDMREKTSTCIDIPDMDADTLGNLLLYIYEDKVPDLTWEAAVSLFKSADKYELSFLKEKCSCFLKKNLLESNVCEILVLADMHRDENLKMSVQEFILNNSEIVYSDAWKVFKEDHSKLALETTEQIIYNLKHPKA